jgi:class 3 adenylate cyclase
MKHPVLTTAIESLERAGFAGVVWDEHSCVIGVSEETLKIFGMGTKLPDPLLGRHLYSPEWVELNETSQGGLTLESQRETFRQAAPWLLSQSDAEALRGVVDPRFHDLLDEARPGPAPQCWSLRVNVNFGDRTLPLDVLNVQLHDPEGEPIGGMTLTKPAVGGAVMAMLATGDAALFERMLRLLQPARRSCAMLFADLESSTSLSRRLSTQTYFSLIRRLSSRADRSVVDRGGLIGKHVGDGITAFFLAEDGESATARACIESAWALQEDAAAAASRSGVDPEKALLRIGLHWGTDPYIGRLLTSGRTEVTALGQEVNEGARIEACAPAGGILASKALLERLDAEDARVLGIDPADTQYLPLAELSNAPEKARLDAPALAVTRI